MTLDNPETIDLSGQAFSPLSSRVSWAFVLGPPAGLGLLLLLVTVLASPGTAGFVAGLVVAMFIGGGKLVILAGAVDGAPAGPWSLALLIVYVDLATSLFVLGGMQYLYRLPRAGRRLAKARASGWRLLQGSPWMYKVTWLSLAGFIAVPFQGTGAALGVLIGRLLGLSRTSIVTATGCGSLVGSSALALVGNYWEERITAIAQRPLFAFVAMALIVSVTILASHLAFGRSRRSGEQNSGVSYFKEQEMPPEGR